MLYVTFLQGLFNAAPPGSYHWEPTEDSEIFITDENPINAERIGSRPGISVQRNPVQMHSLGFDDMENYSFDTGAKTKSILVPGTMTIHCLSRKDLECDRIAWVVFEQLWANREILMQAGLFEVGRGSVVGAPSPAGSIVSNDSGDEFYVVSVTSPFQFNRTTKVTPLGKQIVRGIELALQARMLTVAQQRPNDCVTASPGADPPVQVQGCLPDAYEGISDAHGFDPNPGHDSPRLPLVPHPLNPTQLVRVRSTKPNCPAVKPPSIGGRRLPISTTTVEESCGNETDPHVTSTSTVKV